MLCVCRPILAAILRRGGGGGGQMVISSARRRNKLNTTRAICLKRKQVPHRITQARQRNFTKQIPVSYRRADSFLSGTFHVRKPICNYYICVTRRCIRRTGAGDKACEKGADRSRAFRNPVRLFRQHTRYEGTERLLR